MQFDYLALLLVPELLDVTGANNPHPLPVFQFWLPKQFYFQNNTPIHALHTFHREKEVLSSFMIVNDCSLPATKRLTRGSPNVSKTSFMLVSPTRMNGGTPSFAWNFPNVLTEQEVSPKKY